MGGVEGKIKYMGLLQSFSGSPVNPNRLDDAMALIEAAPYGRFKLDHVRLSRVTFYQKPEGNTTTTTKGLEIYLSSGFFDLEVYRQARILVHESQHTADQLEAGLYWWLTRYLVSPWFRLEAELAGLARQIEWDLVWRRLPESRFESFAWETARAYKKTYSLGPFISEGQIQQKIRTILLLKWAFIRGLTGG